MQSKAATIKEYLAEMPQTGARLFKPSAKPFLRTCLRAMKRS